MTIPRVTLGLLVLLSLFSGFLLYHIWIVSDPGVVLGPGLALTVTEGSDFLNYWAGPQIAQHNIQLLFTGAPYEAALRTLYDGEFEMLRWSYPLHMLLFCAPFAALPYLPALALWLGLGLLAYITTAYTALPQGKRMLAMVLLAAPVTFAELVTRQNGFYIGAAALGVLLLLHKNRPVLAGILLGCLTIKPQLFILWPLVLLLERQWRCLAAATATTLLLLSISLLLHGAEAWQGFIAHVPSLQWRILSAEQFEEKRKLYHLMMPGLTPALRLLSVPDLWVQAAQILLGISVVAGTILAWSRSLSFSTRVLILATGSVLLSPYSFNYDMTLVTVALILRWAERPPERAITFISHFIVYLLPLLVYYFNLLYLPLSPLFLALVFFGAVREALRQPLKRASA